MERQTFRPTPISIVNVTFVVIWSLKEPAAPFTTPPDRPR
jgi:hypothetical protein